MSNLVKAALEGVAFRAVSFRGRPCVVAQEVGEVLGYSAGGFRASLGRWQSELVEGTDFAVLRGQELEDFRALLGASVEMTLTSQVTVLFESGLYLVCLKTDKPRGKALRRLLADEVLPSLARGEAPGAGAQAPATEHQTPGALESYREGVAALERAKAEGAIDGKGLAVRQAALLKRYLHVDILSAPADGFADLPKLPAALDDMAEGESYDITKKVDARGHYTANALGAPHGLPGRAVGDIARRLGIFKVDGWGKLVPQRRADGKQLDDAWLYNERSKERLTPEMAAEAERRAAKPVRPKRVSPQTPLASVASLPFGSAANGAKPAPDPFDKPAPAAGRGGAA